MAEQEHHQNQKRVLIIACGVLELDLSRLMKDKNRLKGLELEVEYLEGGLHDVPDQLRTKLQERIDEVSASGDYDRIVLGYGLCGRGTAGLYARNIPFVIPRVQDCIALFLGSDAVYRREFRKNPGTYYISGGWYEEQVQPQVFRPRVKRAEASQNEALRKESLEYFEERYGRKNAEMIYQFYNSWQKNYSRAGFIDTGAGDTQVYDAYARDMAEEFGWKFERLEGSLHLLEAMILSEKTTDEVLFVAPHHVTQYEPRRKGLIAVPVWKNTGKSNPDRTKRKNTDRSEAEITDAEASEAEDAVPDVSGREKTKTYWADASAQRKHQQKKQMKKQMKKPAEAEQEAEQNVEPATHKLGLGIDAGGTYTDAVIYNFSDGKVLSKGKGLTTKWDYTIGIEDAIAQLDAELLKKADVVSVSTTLATNAIVEGYGQKVGLLLMPSGIYDPEKIDSEPVQVIAGGMTISGAETESVNPEEVRKVSRRMAEKDGVKAFAVSGYAGSVNPRHELAVKEIIFKETGLHVCCGHELSDLLNFYVRANTAVLNSRIISLLETFLEKIEVSLSRFEISVPIMVVKGDGTLMSAEMAKYRPIETILSGPAASIAGARFLTGIPDALVVDVGGTTSDIGSLNNGFVEVCSEGARVGGWRTHVRALDMSTIGLGGDSEIVLKDQDLLIGPRRISPISWLGSKYDISTALEYAEKMTDYFAANTRPLEFFVQVGDAEGVDLQPGEAEILEALQQGPCSLAELSERIGSGHWMMVKTKRLEDAHILQRCGLTPTDLLHVRGEMDLWDRDSALRFAEIVFSGLTGQQESGLPAQESEISRRIFQEITRRLFEELMKKQLNVEGDFSSRGSGPIQARLIQQNTSADKNNGADRSNTAGSGGIHGIDRNGSGGNGSSSTHSGSSGPVTGRSRARTAEAAYARLMENLLNEGNDRIRLSADFLHPIIGLGAPVKFFLESYPEKLKAEIRIPEHADVANAVGAVTSFITVSKRIFIVPSEDGAFSILGVQDNPEFEDFDDADAYAMGILKEIIQGMARRAGTSETRVEIFKDDTISTTSKGDSVFLERVVTAKITGPPDLGFQNGK